MYTVRDFDNLPWNPLKDKKDIESKWKFKAYKEFNEKLDKNLNKDLFYNIMCLVYHRDSQLVIDIDNVSMRYEKALELLNIKPDKNNKYEKGIQDLLEYKNLAALKMIYRFCSVIGDLRFKTFIALSINYDKKLLELMSNNDIEDLTKFNKALNDTLANIEKLQKEVFSKDETVANEAESEILLYARMPGFPELIASGKRKIDKE